ncbi:MFS transporter [Pontibacillus marinus]|uniref:Major facilitator transporter n=1 Tax=Pontibacillus marinus BH030004 = DSM 16465 TaxID=1385511 RepID=A0A0A5GEN2_9BACI|nr:MFS transporter [Pontibacillus marinus]KGX89678.1 major facilitator transporter [Pontibacillus marinus BH030004 = DSM 16465]
MIEARTRTFWTTTIALSIGSLVIFANVYFTQPILPVFTEEFGVTPLESSMSVSLVILALGLSLFFYGPLSDSYGRRGIMIITMLLGTLLTFTLVIVPSFKLLLLIRIFQGVLLAGLPSLALAYIGEEYSSNSIAIAIGLLISGNTIGGMFGRIFSGTITDLYSWRTAFLLMGCINVILSIVFILLLRKSRNFKPKPFNWKEAMQNYKGHILNKELRFAYIIGGLHFFLFVGHFNYVTFLLSKPPYNLPSTWLGLLFLTYLAGTFSSSIAGKVSLRIQKTYCIAIGIGIMVIGFAVTLIPSVFAIILGLLLNCFGFFFAHSTASSWVSKRAFYSKASASGLYLISYYIGGSLGPFYLDPFWNWMGWGGIVLGCYIVLGITLYCTRALYKIERNIGGDRVEKRELSYHSR